MLVYPFFKVIILVLLLSKSKLMHMFPKNPMSIIIRFCMWKLVMESSNWFIITMFIIISIMEKANMIFVKRHLKQIRWIFYVVANSHPFNFKLLMCIYVYVVCLQVGWLQFKTSSGNAQPNWVSFTYLIFPNFECVIALWLNYEILKWVWVCSW